jgi:hypothetical protein
MSQCNRECQKTKKVFFELCKNESNDNSEEEKYDKTVKSILIHFQACEMIDKTKFFSFSYYSCFSFLMGILSNTNIQLLIRLKCWLVLQQSSYSALLSKKSLALILKFEAFEKTVLQILKEIEKFDENVC